MAHTPGLVCSAFAKAINQVQTFRSFQTFPAKTGNEKPLDDQPPEPQNESHFSLMTTVIAITQFVFLTLGIVFLKGIVNANGDISSSSYFQFLDKNWPWLFMVPVAWVVFTQVSYQIDRFPLTPKVARVIGIVLSAICFFFFVSVNFFPSA